MMATGLRLPERARGTEIYGEDLLPETQNKMLL
jgi:hypothetical protein